jgi:hypothetical protein
MLEIGTNELEQKWITRLSETLERVRALVGRGEVRISLHGYEELADDNLRSTTSSKD